MRICRKDLLPSNQNPFAKIEREFRFSFRTWQCGREEEVLDLGSRVFFLSGLGK